MGKFINRLLTLTAAAAVLPQVVYRVKDRKKTNNHPQDRIYSQKQESPQITGYRLAGVDGFGLFVKVYQAHRPAKALVYLIHGAMEHSGRYEKLAHALLDAGYAVITNDHRGHGHSVSEDYPLSTMKGANELITDMETVVDFAKSLFPDVPVYLFGHSMGSMLARLLLLERDGTFDKVILTGVPPYNPFAQVGVALANLVSFYQGEDHYTPWLNVLPTDDSWIANNQDHLSKIASDKLSMRHFNNGGYRTMYQINSLLAYPQDFRTIKPDTKILLMVGEQDDQITGGQAGLNDSIQRLAKLGYSDISLQVYPGMKHEIIHEKDGDQVIAAMIDFYD